MPWRLPLQTDQAARGRCTGGAGAIGSAIAVPTHAEGSIQRLTLGFRQVLGRRDDGM